MIKLLKIKCPCCGKILIDLQNFNIKEEYQTLYYHNYWCEECDIDIKIEELKNEKE